MQIPVEMLSEKNYEGTRLIEVTDETILKLKAELRSFQDEANPFLEEMEAISPEMDVFYSQIAELEEKKKAIQLELAPIREKYEVPMQEVEKIEQKASLIKNKLQALVLESVKSELGEFEKARQLTEKDGKIYVEIFDEIEEKVKAIRADNAKKA